MTLQQRIEDHLISKVTDKTERRLGLEVETFIVDEELTRLPTNRRDGVFSAVDLLEEVDALCKTDGCSADLTIEPGGQLEWSSPPFKTLWELDKSFQCFSTHLDKACAEHGLKVLDLAVEPLVTPDEVELIDLEKYRMMDRRFQTSCRLGPWMMRNTTSIQLNISFSGRETGEKMAYLADVFSPFCAILFANGPFMNGRPAGQRNVRQEIWADTEEARCGSLLDHGMVGPDGLFSTYAEWVQTVPAIAKVSADGRRIEAFDGTLGNWLADLDRRGELAGADIQQALRQIFTHVRLKDVLEVRGADRTPKGAEIAPGAFWVGLLMGDKARDRAMTLADCLMSGEWSDPERSDRGTRVRSGGQKSLKSCGGESGEDNFSSSFERTPHWTVDDRRELERLSLTVDLDVMGPCGRTMRSWMEEVCDIALAGLDRRAELYDFQPERPLLEDYVRDFFDRGPVTLRTQEAFQKSGLGVKEFLMKTG